ncbi:MAG: translocation/assembly module TamB domain-containing protein [Muribaculaceae bacterium]|nr:translocation/assembly module TamB domain-containing protein [Muribaculaceae bacterium]
MSDDKLHNLTPSGQAHDTVSPQQGEQDVTAGAATSDKVKHRLIRPKWLRRTLRCLLGVLIFILLIPVLIYVPFIQDWLKDVACYFVSDATGMTVKVDKFRLKFPVDVQLDGVLVLTEKGDTMVQARSLVADVKMLPLLHLDAQINRVDLMDGKYLMMSEDSSMTMRLQAGQLSFVEGSDLNLKASRINLRRPVIKNADISLVQDVWKQTPDSVASPPVEWMITADKLQLQNVHFNMSMLPTIKDLDVTIGDGLLTQAVIDLKHYDIHAAELTIRDGQAKYVTPTAHYIATHPAPVDTISPPSPPYTIRIGKADLNFTHALYCTDSVKPQPGFDPAYIEVSDVDISLQDFYNQASTLRLPIKSITAKERSGLAITSGFGDIAIDSLGINLSDLNVTTPNSAIQGNAFLSYQLMALNPSAPVNAQVSGYIGWDDLYAYMPSLKSTLGKLPNRDPINLNVDVAGTLTAVDIVKLDVSVKRFLALKAKGRINNPMEMSKLTANIYLDGHLEDAGVLNRWFGPQLRSMGVKIPMFGIKGHVDYAPNDYKAKLALKSSVGDASVDGSFNMNAERYDADVQLHNFDVTGVMPSLGVGALTGHITARGAGFDPTKSSANTDIRADMNTLVYQGNNLAPIMLDATLANGDYDIDIEGTNPNLDLTLSAVGNLTGNNLSTDMQADIRHLDLHKLGFMPTESNGAAYFRLNGTADISTYYCDLDASLYDLDWNYSGANYTIPQAFDATFISDAQSTVLDLYSDGLTVNLDAQSPLKSLMASLPKTFDMVMKQVELQDLDMESISSSLPNLTLDVDMTGTGLVDHFIADTGYKFDTLKISLKNDSVITGNINVLEAGNASMTLDTVTIDLSQRGRMLNYKAHIGNRPDNLPEFAEINISGYVGANRLSTYLRQKNSEGKEGYRLGLTAALMDSVINVHLTPLNAMIAYKPWTVNDDNYIQIGPGKRIQADMTASSEGSSIRLFTPERTDSLQSLQVQIANLHIQDFLQMDVLAPPIKGDLNSDLTLVYRGNAITGTGTLGVKQLSYDNKLIGDLDLDVRAGMGFTGNSGGKIGLLYNGNEVAVVRGYMLNDSTAANRADGVPTAFELELKEFPMAMANPFLPAEYMQLTGHLNGKMKMTGEFTAPVLNGSLTCDTAGIRVPMANTTIRLDNNNPIVVDNNILRFNKFDLYAANDNPIQLDGSVDATSLSNILIDLALDGDNVALVDNKRTTDELYGKLFINLDATAKGPLSFLDIDASMSILPATDIYYTYATMTGSLQQSNTTDVVRFVQFNDTTHVEVPDSVTAPSSMNMRINASLNIVNGTKATVNLSTNGTDKVTLSPYGELSYTQNYMGDMRLNGSLFLGTGFARYSIPMIGEKTFNFDEGSYVNWSGELMNPALHINATDRVKANVQQEGVDSRLIYFDVGLAISGNLSAPKVTFDLATDDDMTVQNELLSMTAEQRSASAMHLLLTNSYTGPGVKASANLSNPLYSFLEGQLNSWAAKTIKGVDLSFGIDNYKQTVDGEKSTTTSYSYQVSKSLFDNRFKIIVGGNYSTDAQADENFAENLISDISFEYALKQSTNLNMYLRLFRHTGYESILEGEVTETGVGFVMRRKLNDLRSLFRFGHRKKKSEQTDSLPSDNILIALPTDSLNKAHEDE